MPSSRHTTSCVRRSSPGRASRTTAAVLAAGASLALVAGCASATGGTGTAAAGAAAPAAATSAAAPTLVGLAGRVATAVGKATSVHVAADLSGVSGLPVPVGTVDADVALTGGKPTAADARAGAFALRYVGGTAWVTLPGAPAATPWTLVSPGSANPVVAAAAGKLAGLQDTIAGIDATALLGAASDLREVGAGEVDGTAATQYTFRVDPRAVAAALGAGADRAAGVGPVPVQLWLDGSDRPLRVTATPTVDGTATPVTVTLSGWNAPVTITAPPAAQVGR